MTVGMWDLSSWLGLNLASPALEYIFQLLDRQPHPWCFNALSRHHWITMDCFCKKRFYRTIATLFKFIVNVQRLLGTRWQSWVAMIVKASLNDFLSGPVLKTKVIDLTYVNNFKLQKWMLAILNEKLISKWYSKC